MSDAFSVRVPIRYRDLDPLDHVNNAVYATYVEEARGAYLQAVLGDRFEDFRYVLATLELSFGRPLTIEDDLRVSVRTLEVGHSSWTLGYDLLVDDESVATAETTIVFVDVADKRPTPIPDELRTRIEAFE